MPDDPGAKLRQSRKGGQMQFERDSKAAREVGAKPLPRLRKDVLSLRDIGELVGVDRSRAR